MYFPTHQSTHRSSRLINPRCSTLPLSTPGQMQSLKQTSLNKLYVLEKERNVSSSRLLFTDISRYPIITSEPPAQPTDPIPCFSNSKIRFPASTHLHLVVLDICFALLFFSSPSFTHSSSASNDSGHNRTLFPLPCPTLPPSKTASPLLLKALSSIQIRRKGGKRNDRIISNMDIP
ncbi:unnamed protein product [Lepeophtheirus salmonis]|uniref:(salmon louse) hypothetical protein n=1 Tax=Lepeophtheirus salmonis TaxID=72036 RepID=A0A7R8H1M2_LEPSM|nr:unnamed protein product [Lepeophtheirus salmonis]CAF2809779.1 unnamed protein product [Lepeophtheirus salmonis]